MSRPNLRRPLGTKGWVLGSNVVSVVCLSISVLSGMAMQGTRGKSWPLGRLTRTQLSCPIPHCSTELVNHLSLAHAAVSTVR